jgi:uncharacterized protein with FMN-binding domain
MKNIINKKLPAVILLIIIINLFSCTGVKQNNEQRKSEVIKVDLAKVGDGDYAGKYNVNINSASVLVSVKNGVIQNIKILKHHHGPGYGVDKLTEEIIKKQTLEVDVITGATKSSYVLKKAIENALRQGI